MVSPRLFRARLLAGRPVHPSFALPSRRGLSRVVTVGAALLVPLGVVPAALGAARTPTPAAMVRAPFGGFDTLAITQSGVRVSGWAVDPDATAPTVVEIQVDGKLAATTPATAARAELAQAYPQYGAQHGFVRALDLRSGAHTVCVIVRNTGTGPATVSLGCQRTSLTISPFGSLESVTQAPNGISVVGWAADSDTTAALAVSLTVNGTSTVRLRASTTRPDVAAAHPTLGAGHGFNTMFYLPAGSYQVCAVAENVGAGRPTTTLGCRAVTVDYDPVGATDALSRGAGVVTVSGWAVDPETSAPTTVRLNLDGKLVAQVWAAQPRPGFRPPFSGVGLNHGFRATLAADGRPHTVCPVAVNRGRGKDRALTCRSITGRILAPSAPRSVSGRVGVNVVDLTWGAPADNGGGAISGYVVTVNPGGRTVTVGGSTLSAHITGLTARSYSFTVRAVNVAGSSAATSSPAMTPLAPPTSAPPISAQTTPALISTSRYIRNIYGVTADAARTRAMGQADAAANPSNHPYLILLQIGGQSGSDGVVLSATSTFVTYTQTVTALKAYLDGYSSQQRANAPVIVAIGTNNDMDVSRTTGIVWAQQIVNPLLTYAHKYPGITIAGANDIEPGFIGSPQASMDWVAGYLAATSAKFVFNGSADGCGTGWANTGCNNGWTASVMQWVSGGASPSRIYSLPQIYNYDMPLQWKYISLTGVLGGKARINFAGPLTEWTACVAQGGGCGSLTNNNAWTALWNSLSSDSRVRQASLPYGTDLRVN